ncbi:hypothetical protein JCGZ_08718 [Jatropha curcas]|uniref:Uncharacterized protein n=1 Tax=Jatropha curcas TaxID=180498 RepID=A0A067KW48_JATCU|nr:uncharacterized protein LOC105635775 [Jatropha curcas]KDP36074.1 hypothetical protein JCGZ_08718 [Jatropha curcas]
MTSSNNSMGVGFMAAFAVSGSVVLIARQLHKRLVSDFMKQIEFELFGSKRSCPGNNKKRVRFAEDVIEPSRNNKEYRNKHLLKINNNNNNNKQGYCGAKLLEAMPLNRQILYKGIIEYKSLKGYNM